jgi:hypothetical protein
MQKIEIGKIYKHYKGNLYTVIALGKHSETLEDMVIYQSIDKKHTWVRPMSMWNEKIDNHTLRFQIVE